METLSNCPICHSSVFNLFLTCTDFSVSKEEFRIVQCNACRFRFTNPRPSKEEIGRYYESENYISHSNTKRGIINNIYHLVRNYTLVKKVELINSFNTSGKNLLDIGCGTGEFLLAAKRRGWIVTGIEPGKKAREFGKINYQLEIFEENKLQSFEIQSFDVISLWHVLEHVHDLKSLVGELKRIIKEKGILLVAVPNCVSADAIHYRNDWAGYDVPRHLYHFTPEDIKQLFSEFGMEVFDLRPMVFDAYYVSILSEKYLHSKFGFVNAVWQGFLSNISARSNPAKYSSVIYQIRKKQERSYHL
jgi:2-polyprenyl-3-methyl-5-hydroxy-6-metoxy-1,4-benzoquinol methylase